MPSLQLACWASALHYVHGQWPKLVRFLENGTWPLGANPVENAIRPFVVGRRSWLFADTVGGANASANLYSLIETAKANNISPTGTSWRCSRSCPLRRLSMTTRCCFPGTSNSARHSRPP